MHGSLRRYRSSDAPATVEVYRAAIRTTAAVHYDQQQVDAWAGDRIDVGAWDRRRCEAWTVVAEDEGGVVGFSDLTSAGVLDMLFVHPQAGGMGVARRLVEAVLDEARRRGLTRVDTHASRSARPVLEHLGFVVDRQRPDNTVRGVRVPNCDMHMNL